MLFNLTEEEIAMFNPILSVIQEYLKFQRDDFAWIEGLTWSIIQVVREQAEGEAKT